MVFFFVAAMLDIHNKFPPRPQCKHSQHSPIVETGEKLAPKHGSQLKTVELNGSSDLF